MFFLFFFWFAQMHPHRLPLAWISTKGDLHASRRARAVRWVGHANPFKVHSVPCWAWRCRGVAFHPSLSRSGNATSRASTALSWYKCKTRESCAATLDWPSPQNLLFGLSGTHHAFAPSQVTALSFSPPASTDLTRRELLDQVNGANPNDVHILETSRTPGPFPVPYRPFISRFAIHARAEWT
ncbi:hypothetical protein IE81DRAFT_20393 [Ceraceosorus guamensis]|uniref:Uncharacterized protein n=1 Tax=Ceraceosorus guamensis TaxID=1522189 RepID=A0A316W6R8_9BASI|nr:hypothetical protein IE81DRAFT_20393 [Ceraceosorus guamensis]PWN44451.1 hypothetical protein IE81DRAFT_20393 [Ceraceosorus guamensis]